jgi:hypothetical protein
VLLVLEARDNLVGDPALVQEVPDIRVEVLDTGHLIGAEQPEQVNALMVEGDEIKTAHTKGEKQ